MKKKNLIALGLAAALSLSLLTACGGKTEETVVKVGVVGSQNDQWNTVNELLKEENIRCEMVEYTAYNMPNDALNAGEVDMNAFQHKAYLNKEIADQGYEISVLGDTIIAPLSVYSSKITSLNELKEGDKIAVPSDATNEGRCFKILESAGVIEVDPAAGYVPELKDITSNPLNLEFVEVEAAYTASQIDDPEIAAAFVNGAHAVDHGLNIADAVYTEQVQPGSDNPYINIIAVRTADLENETYKKVLAAYQSAETAKAIEEIFKGTYLPAFEY